MVTPASPPIHLAHASAAPRPTRRRAWWLGLLVLHTVNGVFFAGVAVLYRSLAMSNLAFQLNTYSIGIPQSQYNRVSTVHAIVTGVHGVYLLLMVAGTLQAGRLAFYPDLASVVDRFSSISTSQKALATCHSGRFKAAYSLIRRVVDPVFSRAGFFGVESPYFDHVHLMRELVETTLQTIQAYRMTRLLPRLWLIRVFVALLVANCWYVPVLHRVYRGCERKRRLMSLMCDAVLDFSCSIGIPLLIFTAYAPQYTDPRFGFPFYNWYNDEWFTNVHQEFQIMLVVSWSDMASRLVFALGVLQSIDAIKDLGVPSSSPRAARKQASMKTAKNVIVPAPPEATFPEKDLGARKRAVHFLLHVVGPVGFAAWGIAILCIHLYAESHHTDWPCKLRLKPWLSASPACSLVEIDCYRLSASGSLDSLDKAWTVFEPDLAARLVIRHCPALAIPTHFQRFEHINSMKIYNSTLTSWPVAAGFTAAAHARMRVLFLVRTHFPAGQLPDGLMTTQFPQTFRSLIISASNLQTLPQTLDRVWPPRLSLAIESSGLTAIPDVVYRLNLSLLSLSGNALPSVPAHVFEIPTLSCLLLANTGLQELPRDVASPSPGLYLLFLGGTNVSTLWKWMDPFIANSLTFHNEFFNVGESRFCAERAQILNGARASFSATEPMTALASAMDVTTPARLAYATAAVSCSHGTRFHFPLPVEDAVSAIVP